MINCVISQKQKQSCPEMFLAKKKKEEDATGVT
jgi:hypothetical protein